MRAALRRPPRMDTGRSCTSAAAAPRACRAMIRDDGRSRVLLAALKMRAGRRLVVLLVGLRAMVTHKMAHGGASILARRRARCRRDFSLVAAPPAGAAPAMLRRCRDGWSEFF
ncbi:hypothetical protein F511_46542 [Dorcoceras hygrometricum]|uniref:Uncharacterized protein n=1 Tax=Dorcoceras hygrometricum TaxID=472368 RepID=A0A2Z7A044_9LAMI|nr:hypothetical protein F511_46542 [Dorcoceras hygrometricum]